jgi:hypothetical protein
MSMEIKAGNPTGSRNAQTKNRNRTRKQFRADNPAHRGSQLKRWPLEEYFNGSR